MNSRKIKYFPRYWNHISILAENVCSVIVHHCFNCGRAKIWQQNSKTFSPWREKLSLDPLGLWRRHLLWGEISNECYSAFICIRSFSARDRFAARYTAQIFQRVTGCFLNFAQILSWTKTVYKRAVNLIQLYTASYNCLPLFIFQSCDCPQVMCD